MILGISASGRGIVRDDRGLLLKGVTEDLIKLIIKDTGEPYKDVSLRGKKMLAVGDAWNVPPITSVK